MEKVGDIGSFEAKFIALKDKGLLSNSELMLIESLTEAGPAAIHRGHATDSASISTVMDILESMFHKFYIQPDKDRQLLDKAGMLKKNPQAGLQNKNLYYGGRLLCSFNPNSFIVSRHYHQQHILHRQVKPRIYIHRINQKWLWKWISSHF